MSTPRVKCATHGEKGPYLCKCSHGLPSIDGVLWFHEPWFRARGHRGIGRKGDLYPEAEMVSDRRWLIAVFEDESIARDTARLMSSLGAEPESIRIGDPIDALDVDPRRDARRRERRRPRAGRHRVDGRHTPPRRVRGHHRRSSRHGVGAPRAPAHERGAHRCRGNQRTSGRHVESASRPRRDSTRHPAPAPRVPALLTPERLRAAARRARVCRLPTSRCGYLAAKHGFTRRSRRERKCVDCSRCDPDRRRANFDATPHRAPHLAGPSRRRHARQ